MKNTTKEKEVRILYCPYDKGEVNYGTIQKDIKERLGYKGIAKPYTQFGLQISKIIIGNKCINEITNELKEHCLKNGITNIVWKHNE